MTQQPLFPALSDEMKLGPTHKEDISMTTFKYKPNQNKKKMKMKKLKTLLSNSSVPCPRSRGLFGVCGLALNSAAHSLDTPEIVNSW
jgi:hypothetical protein